MIELEQSLQLENELHVRFKENGFNHSNLSGSLYITSSNYKPIQLVITYDTLWLRCKYFNTLEEAKQYLNNMENILLRLAKNIREMIFEYEYDLIENNKAIEMR